jgi:hypothetical protein
MLTYPVREAGPPAYHQNAPHVALHSQRPLSDMARQRYTATMGRPVKGSSTSDLGGVLCFALFAATVVAGVVGAVYALVLAAIATDPGPDRRLGLLIMAVATGGSFVAAVGAHLFGSQFPGDTFYLGTYAVFFSTLCVAAVLSIGVENLTDNQRSPASAPATLSHCTPYTYDNGGPAGPQTRYNCTYTWVWDGIEHHATLNANSEYPDGTPSSVHVNPSTGAAYERSIAPYIVILAAVLFMLPFAVVVWMMVLGHRLVRVRRRPKV